MAKPKISIVWFKRDLRVTDHAPLFYASRAGHPVIPLYIYEPEYWALPDMSFRHWHFVHDCLRDLNANLDIPLITKNGDVIDVLSTLSNTYDIDGIYAHEETGNMWTYQRDLRVLDWCKSNDINITL